MKCESRLSVMQLHRPGHVPLTHHLRSACRRLGEVCPGVCRWYSRDSMFSMATTILELSPESSTWINKQKSPVVGNTTWQCWSRAPTFARPLPRPPVLACSSSTMASCGNHILSPFLRQSTVQSASKNFIPLSKFLFFDCVMAYLF
jgi:hypothetical protein